MAITLIKLECGFNCAILFQIPGSAHALDLGKYVLLMLTMWHDKEGKKYEKNIRYK